MHLIRLTLSTVTKSPWLPIASPKALPTRLPRPPGYQILIFMDSGIRSLLFSNKRKRLLRCVLRHNERDIARYWHKMSQ